MAVQKTKYLNFRPIVFLFISIVFGIIFAFLFYNYGLIALSILALYIAVVFSCVFVFSKVNKKALTIILLSIFFLLSAVNTYFSLSNYDNADLNSHYYDVKGRVISLTETDSGVSFVLDDVNLKGKNGGKSDYKIKVYVYDEIDIDIGDNVIFNSVLMDNNLFYENDFSAENVSKKIKYTATLNKDDLRITDNSKTVFEKLNVAIRETLNKGLYREEFATAYALLTGNDDYIDTDLLTSYREAGVAHIFAVSGLHIGFLATVLTFILKKIKANKYLSFFIVATVLFLYSGVCGFSSSSLRAFIMCVVFKISSLFYARYDGLSSISLAGSIILMLFPIQLFCVGFLLSFTVVTAILLLNKPIAKLFKFLPPKIALSIGSVISAFISSIPILLAFFNQFSLVSVIINLLFIPVVGVIYTLLLISTVIGGIFNIAYYLLFPMKYILIALNYVISFFDYSVFIVGGFSLSYFAIFYYGAMVLPSGLINLKRKAVVILSVLFAFISIFGTVIVNVTEYNKTKCYVLGSDRFCVSIITEKDNNYLLINKADSLFLLSKVNTIKNKLKIGRFDKVFICDTNENANYILTRFNGAFTIDTVYMYGPYDELLVKVLKKSFGNDFVFLANDVEVTDDNFSFCFDYDGRAFNVTHNGFNYAFLSEFKNSSDYFNETNLKALVCLDNLEIVQNLCKPEKTYSYLSQDKYPDGQSGGFLKFYLD